MKYNVIDIQLGMPIISFVGLRSYGTITRVQSNILRYYYCVCDFYDDKIMKSTLSTMPNTSVNGFCFFFKICENSNKYVEFNQIFSVMEIMKASVCTLKFKFNVPILMLNPRNLKNWLKFKRP